MKAPKNTNKNTNLHQKTKATVRSASDETPYFYLLSAWMTLKFIHRTHVELNALCVLIYM